MCEGGVEKVRLLAGDTMIIPAGYIHAVVSLFWHDELGDQVYWADSAFSRMCSRGRSLHERVIFPEAPDGAMAV